MRDITLDGTEGISGLGTGLHWARSYGVMRTPNAREDWGNMGSFMQLNTVQGERGGA